MYLFVNEIIDSPGNKFVYQRENLLSEHENFLILQRIFSNASSSALRFLTDLSRNEFDRLLPAFSRVVQEEQDAR